MSDRDVGPAPELSNPPVPAELRALLAYLLAGSIGGTVARWSKLVGEVTALPIAMHPRSNWRIAPSGKAGEREAIEKAAELVREAHPYVPSPKTNVR